MVGGHLCSDALRPRRSTLLAHSIFGPGRNRALSPDPTWSLECRSNCSARNIQEAKIFNQAAFVRAAFRNPGQFRPQRLAWIRSYAGGCGPFQRRFALTEQLGPALFRAEFFKHLQTHPNFGNPNNSLTSPLFGRSTAKRWRAAWAPAAPMAASNPLYPNRRPPLHPARPQASNFGRMGRNLSDTR